MIILFIVGGLAMNGIVVRARGQHLGHDRNDSTLGSQDRRRGMYLSLQSADAGDLCKFRHVSDLVRLLGTKPLGKLLLLLLMIDIAGPSACVTGWGHQCLVTWWQRDRQLHRCILARTCCF
jgi:hypothetical protein